MGNIITKNKFFLLLILLFSLSGCDVLYHMVDKEGAQEKSLIGQISPFEANPKVKEVQLLLELYGYKISSHDGILGPQTRVAIANFQQDANLKVTRYLDRFTWNKLMELKVYQLVVDDKLNIKLIQEILKVGGFYLGAVDGAAGARTTEAVANFQKANKLEANGKINYKTLLKMKEYIAFE